MTQVASSASLSRGDEQILNQVFDPESSPEAAIVTIDASLPADPHIHDNNVLKGLKKQELEAIRLVEEYSQKPQLSSTSKSTSEQDLNKETIYDKALDILSTLIAQHPNYASAYNNRAQLRRWRYGDDLMSYASNDKELQSALIAVISDLQEAIRLSSPFGTNTSVSPQQSKLLIQSWTQLGTVFWSLGRRKKDDEEPIGEQLNHDTSQKDSERLD